MRRTLLPIAVVLLFSVGCRKPAPTTPATTPASQAKAPQPAPAPSGGNGGGGSGGAVQGVRNAVNRVVTQAEMKDLHLFIETASGASGHMPTREEIFNGVKQSGNKKLVEFLQEGAIVLTGATTREGVWAYVKDAPTRGGFVVTSQGVETMTADQAKRALGMGQ